MARATRPTRPPGRSTRTASGAHSKAAARARIQLRRYANKVAAQALERAQRSQGDRWALLWLATNRRSYVMGEAPVRVKDTDLAKIAEEQADRIEVVIESMLRGLELSGDQYERGRLLAYEALRAQTVEGWGPA